MPRFRIVSGWLAAALALAVAVTTSVTPSATAAGTTRLEAESMKVSPSWAGGRVRDAAASGGAALQLRSNSTGTTTVSTPASSSVVLRARGQQCNGAPMMTLTVDGKALAQVPVSAASYTDYPVAAQVAAGSHTIVVGFANQYRAWNCSRQLIFDTVTVVATPTPTTTTTTPTTTTPTTTPTTTTSPSTTTTTVGSPPVEGSRLFTGDYSTGDFTQWPIIQTKNYNGDGARYAPTYSASIVNDSVKGKVARFEVRSGDVPEFGGGERSEAQSSPSATGGMEGQIRWYAFSTKFDTTFPQNHASLGWALTNQFHADSATGSPPVGWYVDQRNGYWSLTIQKQSAPGVYLQTFSIFDTPLNVGNWHDVKMQINWSTSDSTGWIRLWLNGVRQKFLNGADTYYVRTLIPGTQTVYYKEGMYREPITPTDIVYHTGFRSATSEAALG